MAGRKPSGVKKRIMKGVRQNSAVPTWVMVRTKRNVRTNPKRRIHGKGRLKVK